MTNMPTVLVIDDDDADRVLYAQWLKKDNYKVIEASDGDDGLKQCLAASPACVVIDFLMSKKDGFQFMIELRKQYQNETPILFISGYESDQLIEDALVLGATQFISKKEINADLLCASVRQSIV